MLEYPDRDRLNSLNRKLQLHSQTFGYKCECHMVSKMARVTIGMERLRTLTAQWPRLQSILYVQNLHKTSTLINNREKTHEFLKFIRYKSLSQATVQSPQLGEDRAFWSKLKTNITDLFQIPNFLHIVCIYCTNKQT